MVDSKDVRSALVACVKLLRDNPPHRGAYDLNGAEYDLVLKQAEDALEVRHVADARP